MTESLLFSPMTIRGTGLASTTHVRFQAIVGGFVGIWSQDEPVVSASATEVHVLAPDIVEAALDGRKPKEERLENLLVGFPFECDEQAITRRLHPAVRPPSVNRQRLNGSGDARLSGPLTDSACAPM